MSDDSLRLPLDPKVIHSINLRTCELMIPFIELGDIEPARFLCECGCTGFVEMSIDDFKAAGTALLPGHSAESPRAPE